MVFGSYKLCIKMQSFLGALLLLSYVFIHFFNVRTDLIFYILLSLTLKSS